MRKLLKSALAGLLALSMLSATGCSKQEERVWKIAVISKSSSSYWTPVWTACDHAEEEMNVEITRYHPEKTDLTLQMPMLEQAVNSDVDAILLAAVDPEEENELLAAANNKGIQIITYDSDVSYAGRACYVGTQNLNVGASIAGMAANLLNFEGKIGVIYHEEGGTAALRVQGFMDELSSKDDDSQHLPDGAGSKQNNSAPELDEEGNPIETVPEAPPENPSVYANIQVVNSVLGESNIDVSKEKATELILNDHVDLIYATNQKGGQGACEAVAELVDSGDIQEGQVKVICIDYFRGTDDRPGSHDASYYIENGILSATYLQNPYNMAYIGIKFARDLLEGKEIEPSLDTGAIMVSSGNLSADAIQFLISQSY